MDIVKIYYDNHTFDQFLELLPNVIRIFEEVIKLLYSEKNKFNKLILLDKIILNENIYEKYLNLDEIKDILQLKPKEKEIHNLMRIIYTLYHLAKKKSPVIDHSVGIELYSSYKVVSMIPESLKRFDKYMPTHEKKKFQVFQLEFLDKVILLTDPSHITTTLDQFCPFDNPGAEYEYVKDPYWLAVEFMRIQGPNHEYDYVINKESDEWNLLQQIKRVITIEEILEICYKYAKPDEGCYIKYYPETGGLARFSLDNYSAHYPRYFIREELRKRGIDIPKKTSEKDMELYGNPWKEEGK